METAMEALLSSFGWVLFTWHYFYFIFVIIQLKRKQIIITASFVLLEVEWEVPVRKYFETTAI